MKKKEFPGLQQAADIASDKAQRFYINLVKANLIVGVIAAIITIFNFESQQPKFYVYFISLCLLVTGLGLTISIKYFKFEDLWYQARALAESAKTLTWRYITCSENFEANLPQNEVERFFTESLQVLQSKFPKLIKFMNIDLVRLSPITGAMNVLRNLAWQERLKEYVEGRIEDQIKWYSSNAKSDKTKKSIWLWSVITAQALSIAGCASLVIWPSSSWNLVGLFTTVAASAIAWLEVRQYQTLIQAYATATMELVLIKSLSASIVTEEEFIRYVLDSENAISREHTMWLAQRRV